MVNKYSRLTLQQRTAVRDDNDCTIYDTSFLRSIRSFLYLILKSDIQLDNVDSI